MKDIFGSREIGRLDRIMGIGSDFSVREMQSNLMRRRLWMPAEVTTALWLDASDSSTVTLTSGKVSEWRDKSGNTRHASQVSADARPAVSTAAQNGLDVVSFDGSNDRLATAQALLSGAYTIIVVARNRVSSQTAWLVGQGTAGTTGRMYITAEFGSSLCIHQLNNGDQVVSGTPTGGHKIYAITRNGTASAIKINGGSEAIDTVDSNTVQNTAFTVGGALSGFGAVDVCELIVAGAVMSADDILRTEGYVAHKWGLATNLPSDHPYKSSPPTI